ncbi:MAG: DNA-binding protein [Clostridia bacterium]|nr:DNA-binding protein [Clostridia bacterium]
MKNTTFLRAEDVAKELGVSESYAYKMIKKLNLELSKKGYITVAGRINRKYFCEKVCYGDYNEGND